MAVLGLVIYNVTSNKVRVQRNYKEQFCRIASMLIHTLLFYSEEYSHFRSFSLVLIAI